METLVIYVNGPKEKSRDQQKNLALRKQGYKEEATITRVIQPNDTFDRGWQALAEAITGSNLKRGIKNFFAYEIV